MDSTITLYWLSKPSSPSCLFSYCSRKVPRLTLVLVSLGCSNKIPQTGGLQTTEIYFSQFWRLESKIMVPADLVWYLIRPHFLVHRWYLLAVSSHGGKGKGSVL